MVDRRLYLLIETTKTSELQGIGHCPVAKEKFLETVERNPKIRVVKT